MSLNRSLQRQLKRHLGLEASEGIAPLQARLQASGDPALQALAQQLPGFLAAVSESYAQAERDLDLRSRSLALSSNELSAANERLRHDALRQQEALDTLRRTTNELLQRAHLAPLPEQGNDLGDLSRLLSELVEQRAAAQHHLAESEARFRTLLSNLPGCVYRARNDSKGSIQYVSEGIQQLTGFTPEDLMDVRHNLGLIALMHPEDLGDCVAKLGEAIRQRTGYALEFRVRCADGSQRWVYTRGRAVRGGEDDRVLYLEGMVLDAHEVHLAQAQTLRARQQLEEAIEAIDAGFAMYDQAEKLVICNSRYRRLYPHAADLMRPGVDYETVVRAVATDPKFLSDLGAEPYIRQRLDDFRRGRDAHEARIGEAWIRLHDARTPHGMTVSLRTDITDIKQLNEDLLQARDAAEQALRVKSDFLANMSHEIRTPMHGIIGMTDLALEASEASLSGEARDCIQAVRSSAQALLVVVNDILDFSKLEAGKMEVERIDFSLSQLLRETLLPLSIQARDKGLAFHSSVTPEVADALQGDPGRLRQVLTNLLGNALKFTRQGSVGLEVRPDPELADSLLLTVSDTGVGIKPDQIALIFQAFAQADASTTRQFGGTGLGLTISSRLVERMGGRLWVDSEPGRGSRFHVSLPLVGAPTAHEAGHPAATLRAEDAAAVLPPLRLLLAEDNPINQTLALRLLRRHGHQVVLVENGKEAVQARFAEPAPGFDLVLMDMQMPELGGVEATEQIRALEAERGLARVPVVALTANVLPGYRERCLAAGMDGYVSKPLQPLRLWTEMARVLGLHDQLVTLPAPFDPQPGGLAQTARPPATPEPVPTAPRHTAMPATPHQAPYDRADALERLGDDEELLAELLGMLQTDLPQRLAHLREAVAAGDTTAVRHTAHSLKGSAANLSAGPLAEAAAQLEASALQSELDALPARLAAVEAQAQAFLEALG